MEMLILGAVGLAGYGLSNAGKRPTVTARQPPPISTPSLYDLSNPGQSGIVGPSQAGAVDAATRGAMRQQLCGLAPGLTPFYRSAKTMASSDAFKQDRMELFTGQLDACRSRTGTYSSKKEIGPMFAPQRSAAPVSFSGRQAYVDLRGAQEEAALQVGHKFEGVGPVDPVRVGPGLGLDPSVPAAGGYQQFYRVCPDNVNGYRKTSLPGRTIPGAAPVPGGANLGMMAHATQASVKPMWTLDGRPLQEARAAYTAPAQYGAFESCTRPEVAEGYAGHASHHLAPGLPTAPDRGRTDDRFCGFLLNPTGQSAHQGGYRTQTNMDPGAFRKNLQALPTGAPRGWAQGGFQTAAAEVRPTQREQGGFSGSLATGGNGAPPTRNQQVRQTGRETLDQRHFQSGVAGAMVGAPALTLDAGVDTGKPDLTCGYMPGAGGPNQWNPQVTTARVRQPPNAARLEQGGMVSVNYSRPGEDQRCYNKLPIENQHLDLSLGSDVLSTNRLTHPLPYS